MTDRLRESALWTGALLGLFSLVAGVAVMGFGFTFLIFRSGSMGPEIPTGSLALARTVPAADLADGDVVSVLSVNGARVTHRLVSSTVRGDEASLILQGDANATPDDEVYLATEAERVVASVPYAGYVLTVLLSPAGLVAAGCLSGMLLLLGFGSTPASGSGTGERGGRHRGDRARQGRRSLAGAGAAASLVAAATVAGGGVSTTSAYFTDQATLTTPTNGFTAATIATPATPTPQRQPTTVTISWSPETSVGATRATAYQVLRFSAAAGGTGTVVCTVDAPAQSCSDTSPVVGNSYYLLRARIGTNWINDSARALCCIDLTPPIITFTGPPSPASAYVTRQDMQAAIKTACDPIGAKDTPACGQVNDPSGIGRVQFQLRRTTGLPGSVECYDDNKKWTSTCAYYDAQLTTLDPTTSVWQIPNKSNDAYKGSTAFSYTLSIIAVDGAGNATSPAATITYSTFG